MDFNQLYNTLLEDFNLKDLPDEDREEMLFEVAKTIQKQFLLDIYDKIGPDQFEALKASAQMGDEFYATTMKHIVPDYEDIFQKAREKVVKAFKSGN